MNTWATTDLRSAAPHPSMLRRLAQVSAADIDLFGASPFGTLVAQLSSPELPCRGARLGRSGCHQASSWDRTGVHFLYVALSLKPQGLHQSAPLHSHVLPHPGCPCTFQGSRREAEARTCGCTILGAELPSSYAGSAHHLRWPALLDLRAALRWAAQQWSNRSLARSPQERNSAVPLADRRALARRRRSHRTCAETHAPNTRRRT